MQTVNRNVGCACGPRNFNVTICFAPFLQGLPSKEANRNVDLVKRERYIYFFSNKGQRYDLLFFLGNPWLTKRKANRNVEVLNRNVEIP